MCRYWKKMHTCTHEGDRIYIEMCREGFFSNTVCTNIGDDPILRRSHFPCWGCIKSEARAEAETAMREELEAKAKANEARQRANEAQQRAMKEKQAAELRAKEERIRREAREKAIREREEELRVKREKEDEEKRARKEGGLWIETGNGRKTKGRRIGGNSGLTMPLSAPAIMKTAAGKERKENIGGRMSPKKEKALNPGGRAGVWGPTKILSRKENIGGIVNSGATDTANVGASGGAKN